MPNFCFLFGLSEIVISCVVCFAGLLSYSLHREMPAGVGVFNTWMIEERKAGGESLCDPLGMRSERKERHSRFPDTELG